MRTEKAIEILNMDIDLLKKALTGQISSGAKIRAKNKMSALESAIDALKRRTNNGWIPTAERMPDKYGTVIVAWRPAGETADDIRRKTNGRCSHYYEMLDFDPDGGWLENIKQNGSYEILAWTPLPELLQEENE